MNKDNLKETEKKEKPVQGAVELTDEELGNVSGGCFSDSSGEATCYFSDEPPNEFTAEMVPDTPNPGGNRKKCTRISCGGCDCYSSNSCKDHWHLIDTSGNLLHNW